MRQRTAVAAAVLALMVGLTAACGGKSGTDGTGGDNAAPASKPMSRPAQQTTAPVTPSSEAPVAPEKDLSTTDLEKVILAKGDVSGFNVGPMEPPPLQGETADKAECIPITAVINGKPEPVAQASVYRQLTGAGDGRPAVSEFLTAHGAQGAATVLSRLRTAVEACERGFTSSGGEGPSAYKSVKKLSVAKVGDDAFAYQVTGDFEGDSVPLVFQVVRSGGTLATFYTANLEGPQTPTIPSALLAAQIAKLK